MRLGLGRMLRQWGAFVDEAGTEEDAIRCLAQEPALIVTDVRLSPGGSGLNVVARAMQARPAPTVVAITGEATPAEAFRLAQLGVQALVTKPIDQETFMATIEAVLDRAPDFDVQIARQVGHRSYGEVLEQVRRAMLEEALARSGGNRMRAAKTLEVTRQAVQQMIRDLGVAAPKRGGVT